jgi:CheY-like chemotaxis protein
MIGNIWGLFVQSDRTLDRSQGGLGIGLTLVKSLAEMHGGRVGVHSEGLGQGSEFLVAIPLLTPVASQEAETTIVDLPAAKERSGSAPVKRVLVVDDNQDAALMLSSWLESRGYDVQVAHNGAQGLVLAIGWQPDVALLDIGMPEMDGYELARQLRKSPAGREMRLIAVTGYGQPADQERALDAGFNFHTVKPVNVEELSKMIESE